MQSHQSQVPWLCSVKPHFQSIARFGMLFYGLVYSGERFHHQLDSYLEGGLTPKCLTWQHSRVTTRLCVMLITSREWTVLCDASSPTLTGPYHCFMEGADGYCTAAFTVETRQNSVPNH